MKLRKYISETGYELVSMNKTKEKTLLDSDVALTVVLDMKSTTEHQNVLDAFNNLDYKIIWKRYNNIIFFTHMYDIYNVWIHGVELRTTIPCGMLSFSILRERCGHKMEMSAIKNMSRSRVIVQYQCQKK